MKKLKDITEDDFKHLHRVGDGKFFIDLHKLVGSVIYDELMEAAKDRDSVLMTLRKMVEAEKQSTPTT